MHSVSTGFWSLYNRWYQTLKTSLWQQDFDMPHTVPELMSDNKKVGYIAYNPPKTASTSNSRGNVQQVENAPHPSPPHLLLIWKGKLLPSSSKQSIIILTSTFRNTSLITYYISPEPTVNMEQHGFALHGSFLCFCPKRVNWPMEWADLAKTYGKSS